jgi:DNA-binding GntR family transcriptional regulator
MSVIAGRGVRDMRRQVPILHALLRRDVRRAESAMQAHLAEVADRIRPAIPIPKKEETP